MIGTPRIIEAMASNASVISITVDGEKLSVRHGRSILAAILAARPSLRVQAASGQERAGYCLMGACQECWVWRQDGSRIRACTTPAEPGDAITTSPPSGYPRHG